MKAVLLAHASATLFMVGVIWIVQVVHYPLFGLVGGEGFSRYAADHARLISFVVVPAMLVELATAIALTIYPGPVGPTAAASGLGLVVLIWACTFFVQVPLHTRLGASFDASAHAMLVGTNWVRTVLWTVRGGLVVAWLSRVIADTPR